MTTLDIQHNLNEDELFKAIVSLAKSAGLEERVSESLNKSLPSCDCPKEPKDPIVLQLKNQFDNSWLLAKQGIVEAVDKILIGERSWLDIFKAKPATIYPDGPLTKEQIQAIQQAIRDRFDFIASTLDSDFTPDQLTLRRWKKQGIISSNVSTSDFAASIPGTARVIRNAFVFGRLNLAIEKGARSYDDILKIALSAPLSTPDQYAVQVAEKQAASYISQFGESLSKDVVSLALKRNRQIIHDMAVKFHKHELKAVKLNSFADDKIATTWQEFKSELYHVMDDKSRDWGRIAFYEIYDAKRYGEGLGLLAKYGPEQLVYKTPMTTACAQCKYLYLNGNIPRLFRLTDMLGYGNNIGRKPMPTRGGVVVSDGRADGEETLKPVAGLVHPWCQCEGVFVYTGMEWWADQVKF